MSGQPTREGVAATRDALIKMRKLRDEETELVGRIRLAEVGLAQIKKERAELYDTLQLKLSEMDLISSGNTGYEHRMRWFLEELTSQAGNFIQSPLYPTPTPPLYPTPTPPRQKGDDNG